MTIGSTRIEHNDLAVENAVFQQVREQRVKALRVFPFLDSRHSRMPTRELGQRPSPRRIRNMRFNLVHHTDRRPPYNACPPGPKLSQERLSKPRAAVLHVLSGGTRRILHEAWRSRGKPDSAGSRAR
jgi:hypothetical protein